MFIIRYLIAALATLAVTLIFCIGVGYSVWQSIGIAFLAVLALQALILCYVLFATLRGSHAPSRQGMVQPGVQKLRDQLFILPK